MTKKIYFLAIMFTITLTFISYKVTYSFFNDTATSTGNTFAAASFFPTPTPTATPSPTIVVNEVSSNGNANTEWVEIYNATGSPIDVSGWKISDQNAFDTGNDDTFPTVSPIPAGGYGVVVPSNSLVVGIPVSAIKIELVNANIGSGLNNDGDAVVLKNSSNTIIDAMNYGTVSVIFATPPAAPGVGQSVARIPNGTDTNTSSDWSLDSSPTMGVTNSL